MLILLGSVCLVLLHQRTSDVPRIEIRNVVVPLSSAIAYQPIEFNVDLVASFSNPFDPTDIALDAEIKTPSGKTILIPGFYNQNFTRKLEGDREQLSQVGSPQWTIRVCPTEPGKYTMSVQAKDKFTVSPRKEVQFSVQPSASPGFIRVSGKDHRYFAYDSGAPYFPIGSNIAWSGGRGTFDYDTWLGAFGAQKANYARLWLTQNWSPFELTSKGLALDGKGFDHINLANAWRLDHVIQTASDNNISLLLTIDSFNTLNSNIDVAQWNQAAVNVANGGPLRVWSDFWKSETMEKAYRAKLRYLVARYGAYTNVFSWELWNEVDLTQDFNEALVRPWHDRMSTYLQSIDPYHHPITTSFSDNMGRRGIDLLPNIDFFQTHLYNAPDLVWAISYQQARKGSWGKPHLMGEVGADFAGPRADEDPTGLQIHDPLWISTVTGCAGGAMPWWWDNLIAPKKLYPLFGALARYTQGVNFPAEDFRAADVSLAYIIAPKPPLRKDLVFANGPSSWAASEVNRPQQVKLFGEKPVGSLPLSGIQHGIVNHIDLHNPVTFTVDFSQSVRFEVEVGDVSGYGGAGLKVALDGRVVITKEFADSAENIKHDTLKRYAGTYAVSVPAGKHIIVISNPGKDWFMVSYRFVNYLSQSTPPLDAWALTGNRTALMWFRVQGRSWKSIVEQRRVPIAAPPSRFKLNGLATGTWKMQIWDTWKGVVLEERTLRIPANGEFRATLPAVETDIAVKLIKQSI